MSVKTVNCNLCGQDDYEVLFPPGAAQVNQIVKCRRCGLMYANPLYGEVEHVLMDELEQDLQASNNEDGWREGYALRLEKEKLQTRDFMEERTLINGYFPQRGRMLEVGSGFGCLLNEFRKDGWQVEGVEPFAGFCKFAKEEFDIDCFVGVLEEAKFEDETFDAVVMCHVIEHVPDPVATFAEIYRILKPGGLMVIETPTYDTPSFKLLGRRERSLSCDTHIFFYTLESLRKSIQTSPFQIVKARRVGRSLTLGRLLWNLAIVSKQQPLIDGIERVSKTIGLENMWMHINIGDMQRVCARKPVMGTGRPTPMSNPV